MIIQPKVRGFICTNAHPVGCAANVREQIGYTRERGAVAGIARRVLVVGSSTGYGLASRVVTAFAGGAGSVGVYFERPPQNGRTGSAGWYNARAFQEEARGAGLVAEDINGDAFSDDVKGRAVDLIRTHLGAVDLVVYSLAAPRRVHPRTGEVFRSTLKPVGAPFTAKTLNVNADRITEATLPPATDEEIAHTVAVMGGEDWEMWIDALREAGVLAPKAVTVAYSYVGPRLTYPVYRNGTIGKAKEHLEATAKRLDERLSAEGGRAFVSVNKALVTQASAAIPFIPLYYVLLMRVMKAKGIHEDCIRQMYRLFAERLCRPEGVPVDAEGRIRIDDLELRPDVQEEVQAAWDKVDNDNLRELADIEGYHRDFMRLFGFGLPGVDYQQDVPV